jgi:tetratricopeptide (TPR) repeat protein
MAKKVTHQQIRKSLQKDEFREFVNQVVVYTKNNIENLLISAVIVAVAVILVPLYFRNQAANEMRASNLLDRGTSIYMQPVDPDQALHGQGFKSIQEKYQKAQEAYAEVGNAYHSTKAARLSRLGEADSWFYLKAYDKALPVFQEELAKNAKDFFAPTIAERIGVCQENMQKWQEALATYQGLLQAHPDYFNARAVRMAMARCEHHLGKDAEAKKTLSEELAKDPGSYWSEAARQLLALYTQPVK